MCRYCLDNLLQLTTALPNIPWAIELKLHILRSKIKIPEYSLAVLIMSAG